MAHFARLFNVAKVDKNIGAKTEAKNKTVNANRGRHGKAVATRNASLLLLVGLFLSFANRVEASTYASGVYFDTEVNRTITSVSSAEKEKLFEKLVTVKSSKSKAQFDALGLLWNIIKLYCGFVILREKINGDTSTWQNLLTNAGCGIIGLTAMIDGGTYLVNLYQTLLACKSKESLTRDSLIPLSQ